MKKKELEIMLQEIPPPEKPIFYLEQYMTPANIAADIIYIAHQFGDVKNKTIIDLGCGTGIFAVGAKLTGAKKVTGIDIDKNVIETAKKYAKLNNLKIDFITEDIKNIKTKCNTIFMNPPFGAQKSNQKADRIFIEKGLEIADIIYTIHLKKTILFIEKMINSIGGNISFKKEYLFPIKWSYKFHKKEVLNYDVVLLRIEK